MYLRWERGMSESFVQMGCVYNAEKHRLLPLSVFHVRSSSFIYLFLDCCWAPSWSIPGNGKSGGLGIISTVMIYYVVLRGPDFIYASSTLLPFFSCNGYPYAFLTVRNRLADN
jgi:hypothetical protein